MTEGVTSALIAAGVTVLTVVLAPVLSKWLGRQSEKAAFDGGLRDDLIEERKALADEAKIYRAELEAMRLREAQSARDALYKDLRCSRLEALVLIRQAKINDLERRLGEVLTVWETL